ncbi:MAG: GLPGLI family protein, partial [Tannerella sp.]|nr:GLPGLI family protein [Tannerella sp.]
KEDLGSQKWELQKDTLTVCGYLCKKAQTFFRGRHYVAWYAPEIPFSEGPWKFNGLSGLILKINDTKNQVAFECSAIVKPVGVNGIYIYDYKKQNSLDIARIKFNSEKKRYYDNPGLYVGGSPHNPGNLPPKAFEKRPFNPIELTDD